jgi:Family of unknown function (DUF6338)
MGGVQIPTTLTSLLIFVVLLLPGFAYLVGKERNGSERRTSPFRETVAVVAASVTSELAVLVLFAIVRVLWPSGTPDVGALIRHGGTYLRGSDAQPGHYGEVVLGGTVMLVFAVALAYFATWPSVRRFPEWLSSKWRLFKWLSFVGTYPHDSTVSAWWLLFERWPGKRDIQVTCTLDDGWAIQGSFQSFNNSADDSPDRDLILKRPIKLRQPGEPDMHDFNSRYACLSARRIVTLFVSYPPHQVQAEAEVSSVPEGHPSVDQAVPIGQH